MQNRWQQVARTLLLFCLAVPVSLAAQNRAPSDPRGSYYYQAYDQGFRAGQSDYAAGRPYRYQAALVTTAGIWGLSQDYRNAFKLGYQDGYAPNNRRGSDWYWRRHRHDCDCDEDDDRGNGNWSCRQRHDNGKHKGWYKHHKHDRDEDDD